MGKQVSSRLILAASLACCALILFSAVVVAQEQDEVDPLLANWERTDKPVMDGIVNRTWMWGPQTDAYLTWEAYTESPGGERKVIYFDKSRMEITDPDDDRADPWFVTNGLLVVELITGQLQTGHHQFESRGPAAVNVAGDVDDPNGVTYAALANLLQPYNGPQPDPLIWTVDRSGNAGTDERFASYDVGTARYEPSTGHWVAEPFWQFMTSTGTVWEDDGYLNDTLFADPFYATGYPITEAYWATVLLEGQPEDVLLQCFERRCLTWTPSNPSGWEVEAGNVGLHYYIWRYGEPPPRPVG
jgi:hypothetical protein